MNAAFWLRYALRSLNRGGRRTIFALVCVAVGVTGVVALQTASLTVQNALTSNVRSANGGDISVTSQATPLSSSDLKVFQRLRQQGLITQWTAVGSIRASAVGSLHNLVPFEVQVVAPSYPVGGEPTFVAPAGGSVQRLLRQPHGVLITKVLADLLSAHVGSRFFVTSLGGVGLHATVAGIVAETSFEHSSSMTVSQSEARLLTTHPLSYGQIYANTAVKVDRVATILRARFPLATTQTVQEALQAAQQQVHDFQQFLLLVGLLALLIAGIGILNAMQSMLAWRRLEIAMLKAIGFRQGTLYALFGLEALLLGLIGGVLGTGLGAAASKVITDALARALGLQVDFKLDAGTLLGGVCLGIGATLIFAVLPIVRAAAFRPIEILREGVGAPSATGWLQTVGLLVIVFLLFGALAAAIVGDTVVAVQFVSGACLACAVLTGAFALLIGWMGRLGRPRSMPLGLVVLAMLVIATGVAIARAPFLAAILGLATLVWTATVVLSQAWLLPLLIAARSLSRRRSRTSVTLVAFLAGVLAMTVTLTVALSLQRQINDALNLTTRTNLVAIDTANNQARLLRTSRKLSGVRAQTVTTLVNTSPVAIEGRPIAAVVGPAPRGAEGDASDAGRFLGGLSGYDLARGDGPASTQIEVGRMLNGSDAGTNHVLGRTGLLDPPFNLQVGSTVTLKEPGSGITRTVQLIGFYRQQRRIRGIGSFFQAPLLGDRSEVVRLGGVDAQTVVSFRVDPGQLGHDVALLQRDLPGAFVINVGDLTAIVETILNELLNLLAVITALVLGAGLAVVANGVALAMFERRREIALFKAIGFGPRSVLQFVLVENALIGTLAGSVSVLAAALILGIISRLAFQQAIGFDPLLAVLVLVIAAFLSVGTAYLAARKPIAVRPLEALRNE